MSLLVTSCLACSCQNKEKEVALYSITDLGTLGGPQSEAYGINNSSQIVGNSELKGGASHAFLWEKGHMVDLGSFPGASHSIPRTAMSDSKSGLSSTALSINSRGQVVGMSETGGVGLDGDTYHAALWEHGKITDLGVARYRSSIAKQVTDNTTVTGNSVDEEFENPDIRGRPEAMSFIWAKGAMHATSALADCLSLNNQGLKVGCIKRGRNVKIFLWHSGKAKEIDRLSKPQGMLNVTINDNGFVAGTLARMDVEDAMVDPLPQAVFWIRGKRHLLPSFPQYSNTIVHDVNNLGQIVGEAQENQNNSIATLWQNAKILDLNKLISIHSGWRLESASGINNKGYIIGTGKINGQRHAFLMKPNKL